MERPSVSPPTARSRACPSYRGRSHPGFAQRFGLRAGLDVDAAANVLWALTAPDLTDRLVVRRSWGWDRFEIWLGTTMADALLGPGSGE